MICVINVNLPGYKKHQWIWQIYGQDVENREILSVDVNQSLKPMHNAVSIQNAVILSDREEIADFWRESKDLRTDFTQNIAVSA